MEPITLCGAVIVVFGLWVEFEAVIMKGAKAISGWSVMSVLLAMKERRPAASIAPSVYRSYRTGNGLSYRLSRS